MSVEQYLFLTDRDIDYLYSSNSGSYAPNVWHGSAIKKSQVRDRDDEVEEEDIDTSIDFNSETEELMHHIVNKHSLTIITIDELEIDIEDDIDFSELREDID